jgi:hypothetical protein
MISSESINFSKYSKISDNNNKSNGLEIIEMKINTNRNEEKEELSQKLMINNSVKDEKSSDSESSSEISDTIYGNPYSVKYPKYIGKSKAFFYDKNGNPRITIGPDCKHFI